VLEAGVAETGCTVHEVDEEYDRGPTLVERRCSVLAGDTPEALAARVFDEECRAYPEAIRAIAPRIAAARAECAPSPRQEAACR
jgi:phosphoribosylglycinamide formyltransferase-1